VVKLEVKELKVSFDTPNGELQAVRSLSFCLEEGETLAIVGESGSGKSVTSKAVMRLLPKNAKSVSGQILYEGKNLLDCNEQEMTNVRGKKIAMIFQDPSSSLDPIMKIGKQITETILLNSNEKKRDKKYAKERAIELMREVGIPEPELRFYQYPFELSGGMRQRIVIAIALSSDPEILICDEPTTALDVTIQAQILDLIDNLKKQRKLSVLFITHDLGVVARMADRVAVTYAGKIVEYGTAEEIFYTPKHPYTWALLSSMPSMELKDRLETIEGSPPDMTNPPKGDAFARRNPYALEIDFEEEPPFFKVSETHYAATWLLHENAPKVEFFKPKTEKKSVRKKVSVRKRKQSR
jgi:oligopeptide transport system ATP-binding protein